MPGADLARIFGTVFSRAEDKAKAEEDKATKAKQEDIQMYQKVLFDPNSSPEQRQKAADQITKLRGINKKESPFGKIAGLLTHVKSKMPQQGSNQPMDETNPATGKPPIPIPNVGVVPQFEFPSNVGQGQTREQPKPRGQAMQALGRMFSGQGLIPRHPQQLTPIDVSVFPQRQNAMVQYRKDLKEAVPGITDEQLDKAVETKFGATPKATTSGHTFTKKGTASGKEIPEGEKDVLGNSIDKNKQYDVLQNAAGDKEYVASQGKKQIRTLADETGKPADFLVDLSDPTKLIKIGAKPEQAEYKIFTDPDTQEQYAKPVPRYVSKPGVQGEKPKKQMTPLHDPKAAVSRLDKMGQEVRDRSKGISLGKKDTNTARAKAEQALVVMTQGEDLIKQIEASRDALGPWAGRISSFEVGLGSSDEKVRALYTALKSFAALQPALHGSRGIGMQKEFEQASGRLADNPDAAIAAIRSLMNTAKHFAEVGGEGKNVPAGSTPNVDAEKQAQQYLDSIKKK